VGLCSGAPPFLGHGRLGASAPNQRPRRLEPAEDIEQLPNGVVLGVQHSSQVRDVSFQCSHLAGFLPLMS
jgi:hypothetical protein